MGEDVDNLYLHYGLTMILWWDMFIWFDTSWTMQKIVKELMFSSWKRMRRRRRRRRRTWNIVPLALMWVVWRERNRRDFDTSTINLDNIRRDLTYGCVINLTVVFRILMFSPFYHSPWLLYINSESQEHLTRSLKCSGVIYMYFWFWTILKVKSLTLDNI